MQPLGYPVKSPAKPQPTSIKYEDTKKNIKPPKIRTRYPNHLYTNGISFVSKLLGKARKITPRIAALNGSGGRENLAEGRKR